MKQTLNNGESYGSIRTKLNDMFTELYNNVTSALGNITQLASSISDLAGTGRTTETVKGNADGISTLNTALLSHKEDITTHGGIYHKNLFHNWDFRNPVNQRGQSSYSSATGDYPLDRWRVVGNGNPLSISINSDHIELSCDAPRGINQFVENYKLFAGEVVTISADAEIIIDNGGIRLSLSDGSSKSKIISGSGRQLFTFTTSVSEMPSYLRAGIEMYGATGEWKIKLYKLKLELGSKSTLANDPPADYGEQLALCKRHYRLWTTDAARTEALKEVGLMRVVSPTTGTVSINSTTYYYASADL